MTREDYYQLFGKKVGKLTKEEQRDLLKQISKKRGEAATAEAEKHYERLVAIIHQSLHGSKDDGARMPASIPGSK